MIKAAILVAEGVQDQEFFYPFYRLQEVDCKLDVVLSLSKGNRNPKSKYQVPLPYDLVSTAYFEYHDMYDLIIIPGGWQCPEILRMDPNILELIVRHFQAYKLIAAICHGPQVLISALFEVDPYPHLMMTGYQGIMHDIINAEFSYVDKPVVQDKNVITAQHYKNNPEFMRTVLNALQ